MITSLNCAKEKSHSIPPERAIDTLLDTSEKIRQVNVGPARWSYPDCGGMFTRFVNLPDEVAGRKQFNFMVAANMDM